MTRSTSAHRCPDGASVSIVTADSDAGRHVLRHSTAHVLAQAVTQAVPGGQVHDRPGHRERLLLRLRRCPAARTFTDDDLEAHRGARCARSSPRTSRSCARSCPPRTLKASSPTSPTSARSSSGPPPPRPTPRQGRGRGGRRGQRLPQLARVRRPVPRPARAVHGAPRPLQAAEGRRRVLAGRREAPDAPAHLRHGVGERGRARRAPPPPGGGREARPPQAGRRARPAELPRGARRRPRRVASEGRHRAQADGGLQPRRATSAAATSSSTRRTSSKARLFETSGHLDWYADGMYPPMEMDNGVVLPEADELPDALPDLPVSRQRSYRELPLRLFELGTVYRYERAGTLHGLLRIRGFTQDDSHIFCTEEQADERDPQPARLRAVGAAGVRLRGLRGRAVHARPGQVVGDRGRLGAGHRRTCAPPSRRRACRTRCNEGEAAFYGPKIDIDVRDAIGRTLAAVDDPVRLQPARAVRPRVRRRRQRPPPAGHDPPGPVRHRRALLRRAARALRRRLPRVAGAGPGAGAAGQRRPRGLRPTRGRPAAGRGLPGRRGRAPTSRSASASARPSWRSCPTSSSSATTTCATAPSGVNARGGERRAGRAGRRLRRPAGGRGGHRRAPEPDDREPRAALGRLAHRVRRRGAAGRARRRRARSSRAHPRTRACPTRRPTSSGGASTASPSSTPSRTPPGTCW